MKPLLLALLFGALYLTGLGRVGVVDYDEACYAEVARDMFVREDLVSPYLNGEPFFEKPPLLYWGMMIGYEAFGVGAFGARVVNALGAVALLLALYGFARRPLGRRGALIAALVLGSSFGFTALARVAFTDNLLTLWFVVALGALHRAFEERDVPAGRRWYLLAAAACGLAMLTKGAIGVLFPAAAAFVHLALRRDLRVFFRPSWVVPGALVALPLGLSWYLALGWTHEDGFAFTRTLFWEHHVGRFTDPMQGHEGPFFFYVPVLLLTFLPWSPIAALAAWRVARRGEEEPERRRFVLLFAVFGALVFAFFSIAATKLPNYMAPVFPCLAVLVAASWDRELRSPSGLRGGWSWALAATAVLLVLVGAGMLALQPLLDGGPELLGDKAYKAPALAYSIPLGAGPALGAASLLAAAGVVTYAWRRGRALLAVTSLAAGSVAFLAALFLLVAPRLDAAFRAPLRELAAEAAAQVPEGGELVLLGIRHAPSTVFYGGRRTRYVGQRSEQGIAELFAGPRPAYGLAAEAHLDRLRAQGAVEVLKRRGGYVLFRCAPRGS